MAKETSNFANKQELQDYLNSLKQIDAQYRELNKQAKELANVPGNARENIKGQLKALRLQYDTHKEILASIKQAESELKSFTKEAEKAAKALEGQNKAVEDLTDNFSELNTFQRSITRQYGEQSDETRKMHKNVEAIKATVGGIGKFLAKNTDLEEDQRDALMEASEYLKSMPSSFDKLNKQVSKGTLNQKKYNSYVSELNDSWEDILDKIDDSDKTLRGFKKGLRGLGTGIGLSNRIDINTKSEKGNIERSALLSGIPGGEGISELMQARQLEKANPNNISAKLKRTVAGAAIGGALANFALNMREYLAPLKAAYYLISDYYAPKLAAAEGEVNVQQAIFNRNAQLFGGPLAAKYGKGMFYVAEATKDFQFEMENLANEFTRASKTAFFGHGIGSVGYGAAAMQLAGVGAEQVAAALTSIASGANVNFFGTTLGSQAAVFSKEMGISTESVADIMAAFRRMDGSSGATALNLTYSAAKLADIKGMNPAVILQDMAEASGKLLSYNIQNKDAFVQQAIALREMGGNLPKFAQGITSSILNYPEAMKAQISLSNILNRSVDFSVAQSLAYQGKYAEAFQNIKQSGVLESVRGAGSIAADMFSKIFGMGIDEFQAKAQKGKSVGLNGSLNAENQSYLNRVVGAEAGFRINAARIQLDKAILDAQFAKVLATGLQSDEDYRKAFKTADSLNAAANAFQSLITGLFTGLGAFLGARFIGGKLFAGNGAAAIANATAETSAVTSGISSTLGGAAAGAKINPWGWVDKNGKPLTMSQATMKITAGGTRTYAEGAAEMGIGAETAGATESGLASGLAKSGKFLKVGGKLLPIVGAGFDAYGRAQQGQSAGQIVTGTGASLAGGYIGAEAGAGYGASIGTMISPGIGTAIGGVLGGMIGGAIGWYGGGKAADFVTGAGQPAKQQTISSGGDTITILKNIELLVAGMANADKLEMKLMLDGKDISNSVIQRQLFNKGNSAKSTLKQVLGN